MHDKSDDASSSDTRWSLRRGVLVFAAVAAVEVLVVLGVAGWALAGARDDLVRARQLASSGRSSATELDLEAAAESFSRARDQFSRARAKLANPAVRVLKVVPATGPNLRTIDALAVAGATVAGAAGDLTGVIIDQPDGLGSYLPSDGRFPVDRLAALADAAETADRRLADAAATVATAPDDGLVGPVAAARAEFAGELAGAQELVGSAARASRSLSAFLGVDGPRRYLFGAQNPAELRGTGGYIGAYAEATFDRGTFELNRFVPIQSLTSLPVSDIPPPNADYAARYNRYGGAGFWPAINATPDFPSAAQAMQRLYERTEETELDGVMVVDPFALEALLDLTGEVRVPGIGRVDADNAVAVMSNEAYEQFGSPDERKEVLGEVAAVALRRLLDGTVSVGPEELRDTLVPMVRERRLLLYSADPTVQAALRDADLAGALPEPEVDTVAVVVNNVAVNKVDYFVDRSVDYRVELQPDGSATARLVATLSNTTVSDDASYVLGQGVDGLEPGDNRSLISVFCGRCDPIGAKPALRSDEPRAGTVLERELGHTVATALMTVPATAQRSFELSWRLDDAWSPSGTGCYDLRYIAQPTIRSTRLRVEVAPPAGYARRTSAGGSGDPGPVVHDGPVHAGVQLHSCYAQ